jgi:DNA-binding XRE family transcriptional regulator
MPQKRNNKIRQVPDDIQQKLTYIGQLVKETRLTHGMTQVDFAKQQGISKNSLQNLEYGRNVTLLSLFITINENYSPKELFEELT